MRLPTPLPARGGPAAGDRPVRDAVVAPPDPRLARDGPLDPVLEAIRAGLRPHRRRLWLRRIVRRAWLVAGAVLVAEVGPVRARAPRADRDPAAARARDPDRRPRRPRRPRGARRGRASARRPSRVDAEAHLGDRVASALALAAAFPDYAGPRRRPTSPTTSADDGGDETREAEAFVRRQRADAASGRSRIAPPTCSGRASRAGPRRPCSSRRSCSSPLVLLPNPQDAGDRPEPARSATRPTHRPTGSTRSPRTSSRRAPNPNDPRTQLAQRAARPRRASFDPTPTTSRRTSPARRASRPTSARSSIPANEQRASSLTSLSRALSRAATGQPDANKDGDPKVTADDLKDLGEKLDQMTDQERRDLAAALAGLQSTADPGERRGRPGAS